MGTGIDGEDWTWVDWLLIGLSIGITCLYHIIIRRSKVGRTIGSLMEPWAAIMESSSKNSLIAAQTCRNLMALSAFFASAAITGATLFAGLTADGKVPKVETSVVVALYLLAFFNFAMCMRCVHDISYVVACYPTDLVQASLEQDPSHKQEVLEYSAYNKVRLRKLLFFFHLHKSIGRHLIMIAIPATCLIFSVIALIVATIALLPLWYYMDTYAGNLIGFKTMDDLEPIIAKMD
jgi:hypothetical protein